MSFKVILKTFLRAIFFGGLILGSGEILFRRWVMGQIPTQVSSELTYTILLLNGFILVAFFLRWVKSGTRGSFSGNSYHCSGDGER